MKKFLASAAFVLAFAAYGVYNSFSTASGSVSYASADTSGGATQSGTIAANTPVSAPAATASTASAPATKPVSKPVSKPVPTPTPAPVATKPRGQYVDGSYTGSVADAYYGNVQVKVTVSGGKIADVAFLQYPNDRSTSVYINSQAMPILRSEAIQAQSAKVSTVSGASDTSAAFRQSLASALAGALS